MSNHLGRRDRHLRLACLVMIVAIGLYAAYAGLFEPRLFQGTQHWAIEWSVAYLCFLTAHLIASRSDVERRRARLVAALAAQCVLSLLLVWLFPSFIVTCLVVVVAWQIAWVAPLRSVLAVAGAQAIALAVMKCATPASSSAFPFLILAVTIGFQAFAINAARLARSEAGARDELAKANMALHAAQALMTENARMEERLRISRDLHDVLGHGLTTLAIHLDVAARLADGQALDHVKCARGVADALLAEVRSLVNRIRIDPVDLRTTLRALAEGALGIEVELNMPDEFWAIDPARADAIVRCIQEVITNTLRHARASRLTITLAQDIDGAISLATQDDGRGGPIVEGGGLAGMRGRFDSLGGELKVSSIPEQGFALQGSIPPAGAFG
jgi:signal transduction histidine kinase